MTGEDFHAINEPLLTEDGFVNEACLNELEAAIKACEPAHIRLRNDPEWSVKRWTGPDEITGALAKWAIFQSPYHCPENLETVVRYLRACLGFDGLKELSLCDVCKMVHEILDDFPQFMAWNVSKKPSEDIVYVSIYSERDPDTDFIDLDALIHNVCLDIRGRRRADDAFDREFEKSQEDQ